MPRKYPLNNFKRITISLSVLIFTDTITYLLAHHSVRSSPAGPCCPLCSRTVWRGRGLGTSSVTAYTPHQWSNPAAESPGSDSTPAPWSRSRCTPSTRSSQSHHRRFCRVLGTLFWCCARSRSCSGTERQHCCKSVHRHHKPVVEIKVKVNLVTCWKR